MQILIVIVVLYFGLKLTIKPLEPKGVFRAIGIILCIAAAIIWYVITFHVKL